jgi:hypothetical protein
MHVRRKLIARWPRLVVAGSMIGALVSFLAPAGRAAGAAGARASSLVQTGPGATRLGFCGGDDWEPEIAADPHSTYLYVVWAHFPGDPTCDPDSANPIRVYIQVSPDGGHTFGPPKVVANKPGGVEYPRQVDSTVTVDDVTGAVHVCFLAYGRDKQGVLTDVACARSTDHGATFPLSRIINGPACTVCDHEWPAAHGGNVYVTYASGENHYLSRSADGGRTWHETNILQDTHVAFPEGSVVDAFGNAWFAWGDCFGNCTGKNAAIYQVSRTIAGTSSTRFAHVAEGPAGPHCPPSVTCGFAYWGPQDDIAIDGVGNLYLVWQDSNDGKPGNPTIAQLSRCASGSDCSLSVNWHHVGRADDKTAGPGCPDAQCYALYPRIEGAGAGHIAVTWMDDRFGSPLDHMNGWNVWLRTSATGGATWTGASRRVSTYDPSRSESHPNGFEFPYGDYEGIDIMPGGTAAMVWGEGHNYVGGPSAPGHVVYRSMPI